VLAACRQEGPPAAAVADPTPAPDPTAGEPPPSEDRTFELAGGEYLHLQVDQAAVDRVAVLFGPDGERLLKVDSLGGTVEEVHWVAQNAGPHRLEVTPGSGVEGGADGGAIRVVARRPASADDATRTAAEAALADAHALRGAKEPDSAQQAVAAYRRAERLFASLGLAPRQAEALFGLALVLRDTLAEPASARQLFEEAAGLAQDPSMRGDALQLAAQLAAETGDQEAAIRLYETVLEVRRAAADDTGEALAANNLGNLYQDQGRYDAATRLLERSAALREQLGDGGERATTLANLGRLELEMGKVETARDRFEQAIELARQAHHRDIEAGAHHALGKALLKMGRPAEARAHLATALDLQPGPERGRALTLTTLGVALRRLDDPDQAHAAYLEALAIFRDQGDAREEAQALHNLGYLELYGGDGKRALELLDEALQRFGRVADPMGEVQTRLVRAQALRGTGDLPAARREALLAVSEIERWRSRSWRLAARAAYFASRQEFYDFLIDVLMEMDARAPAAGWDAEALQIAERARARSLLDALAAGGDDPRGGSGSRLLEEEWELERRITAQEQWARRRAEEAATGEQLRAAGDTLGDALRPLQLHLETVRAEIRAESPRWAALTQPQPLSARQIQEQLDGETLLLEYRLGERQSTLWAVTRERLESYGLPAGRAEIEAAVRRTHGLLRGSYSRKRGIPAQQELDQLATLLLSPVADRLAGKRLVVVADGALQYLPFAALPIPAGGGEPLLARHQIVALPSASALAELRRRTERRPPAPRWLWVLADPAFGDRFAPLPRTLDEAHALIALTPAGDTELVAGVQASRQAVIAGGLDRFRILHFATHGVFEAGSAGGSRLILAQVDAEGSPLDEGLLSLADIYRLELSADLVVLSACETALGEEIRGEGLVGLTQGFFHAGAGRVVVSLWSVPDRVTAELMEHFYRGMLERHLPPPEALRQAQQAIRLQAPWSAPYYWAGFLLQGEWRGLPGPAPPGH
jgi:CHAT domain-containing protein/tetratricopeptide (TPR) repeat protein